MNKIIPVILCGGSGERLWPLSRKKYPKQFHNLVGQGSLFQQAASRLRELTSEMIILTNNDYRFLVRQQLHEIGINKADVILEPESKNTAPSILAAACHAMTIDPDAVIVVMPSDHYIPDVSAFISLTAYTNSHLSPGKIICFGVPPTYPETEYGYIETDSNSETIMSVSQFIEKPDLINAEEYVADGNYLWNVGIFIMRAKELLKLAENLQPEMLKAVRAAQQDSIEDLDFLRLDPGAWANVRAESFDYAFMEKISDIGCIAFNGIWSDLGSWTALAKEYQKDKDGNTIYGSAYQINTKNSTLWSTQDGRILTAIGLNNILAVAMGDTVLIADKNHTKDIKTLVRFMNDNDIYQSTNASRDYRPWGWYETLAITNNFHIKVLHVNPGASLSLQSHQHRFEHWIVISGIATVIRHNEEYTLNPNQSIFITAKELHQLSNHSSDDLVIVEVQTGTYFGEDDIVRYSDVYNRL